MVGTALQSTVSCVVCGYGKLAVRRVGWWWWEVLGWSAKTAAMSAAATEARSSAAMAL